MLTELCLRSTYFKFRGRFFEQVDGAAMGSPLSPVVANLFMEAFEARALEKAPLRPSKWVRYVDDTFVIWPHTDEQLETFHAHLNNINPSIQFTYEKEREGELPFLDVRVQREGNTISTSVYRKATHTDRYINFSSHHHPRIKTGVIHCLKRRADSVCDGSTIDQERKHLQDTFEANGYPRRIVQQALRKRRGPETEKTRSEEDDQERTKLLILPYLKNTSEQIERTCRALGVKPVFKSQCTLRRSLTRVKSARPELKKKEVVYEVPCMDCDTKYIGETGRNLQKRLMEHKAAVRRGDRKNGIAVHLQDHDHRVDWEAAKVIGQEPHYWRRRVLEALHISKNDKTSNLDCGLTLDPIWAPFMSR